MPSRTSILVAAARAFASRDPDERVRNPDSLADLLIGPDELALIDEHPISQALMKDYSEAIQDLAPVFFAWSMIMRTRFIDEALLRSVANGVTQVVVLGAGFDSRAYRFRELLKHCRVIEIDAAPTQQYKRRRLEAVGCEIPPNLTFITIDFTKDCLRQVLAKAGVNKEEKTFYIWEGVSMYLNEADVRRTLSAVSSASAPGSSLVLDYANQEWLEMGESVPQSGMALFRSWGEPWLFGTPNPDGQNFFREHGFDPGVPRSIVDPELVKRHATRSDGTSYGAVALSKLGNLPQQTPTRHFYWLAELTIPE